MSVTINDDILFVTDADVALSEQYTYVEFQDNMYLYQNKTNDNLTYFHKKLVDLNNKENQYILHY
ncbi:hypothetical protein AYR72_gp115 [Cnaphalocrocis medinalis granulovirus]|uniref:PiraGV ORF115 n=1 Tax=Cnaphalocrocis medinalis granulovirus TaxID=1750712 RepID=A0A109WW98_9BBAC|nr:hypothetical protein AYR72_gp115 [Cnaphalocrocis medinalis granulovirus]ALN42061.1 PiraGV ORF115 [Cnaphalocrocis medinalis granulovirus]AMF83866.1 hypothetical protein [Cnaphalocrocis medinalis granulovirus]WPN08748.1 hypothetical protein [Cnaphalocrocis medinalis granulovirus]